jgi:hypothetical protein
MRHRALRAGLPIVLLQAACWLAASAVLAAPATGPRETVEQTYTTTQPNTPTGVSFTGSYHAAGDSSKPPPYMRKMTFFSPPGLRYDTSVPERCGATDIELAVRGAAACPANSRLGGGTSETSFLGRFPSTVDIDVFNNTDEQIMLARSPGISMVARGHIGPDGSIEYASPTCFPTVEPAGCPVDDALQLGSSITIPPYVRPSGSYITTPTTCPESGRWETPIGFWWADGSVDTVVTEQPCTSA